MTNSLPNLFKCAVHPLLQFREVCEKELIRIENDSLAGLSISELLVFRSFKISFMYAVYVSDFPSATPLKPTVYVFVPLDNSFSRL
jgi:hypothetical protein